MRYLRATIVCAFLASLAVAALCELGVFYKLDLMLWHFLGLESVPPVGRSAQRYIFFILLALGVAWTTIDINKRLLKLVIATAVIMELVFLTWALHFYGIVFSPFTGIAATLLSFSFGLVYSLSQAGVGKGSPG